MVKPILTTEHLHQALTCIRAEGGLQDHPKATLAELMAMDMPMRLIRLRALLIALGHCTGQVPTTHHRPQVMAPDAPPPGQHRPWQPPRTQAPLFDPRRAAAGDRDD